MAEVTRIEVEQILRSKMHHAPSRGLIWFLKKWMCEDWFNTMFGRIGPVEGVDFMQKAVEVMHVQLDVKGIENLPPAGVPAMFVCNHPLGAMDVVAVVSVVGSRFPEGLLIPANDMLLLLHGVRNLLIPVNKVGGQHRSLSEKIRAAYASNQQLMFFPAGKVSRKNKGVIRDEAWQKNFVAKSVEYHRAVVPIRIEACNSRFFYVLANLRKTLGIRLNLEMITLPREVRRQWGKRIGITIGAPIPWQSFTASKTPTQWAQEVRERVYSL